MVAVFFHSLFGGLVPPFFDFLLAIFEHYQIRLLHLRPNSILILAVFTYLCEAYLGVMLSVELFRTFYNPWISVGQHRSACASFRMDDNRDKLIIDMRVHKKAERFRQRWFYFHAGQVSRHFTIPTEPVVKVPSWGHKKSIKPRPRPVLERLRELRAAKLTVAVVTKEFVRRCITPH